MNQLKWSTGGWLVSAVLLALALASGCHSGDAENETGAARLSLSSPPDVRCVRITIAGTRTSIRDQTLPAAEPVVLLDRLPVGRATFSGIAFAVGCAEVTSATSSTWLAAPVEAVVSVGAVVDVTLIFQRNGKAGVILSFDDPISSADAGSDAETAGEASTGEEVPRACLDGFEPNDNCAVASTLASVGSGDSAMIFGVASGDADVDIYTFTTTASDTSCSCGFGGHVGYRLKITFTPPADQGTWYEVCAAEDACSFENDDCLVVDPGQPYVLQFTPEGSCLAVASHQFFVRVRRIAGDISCLRYSLSYSLAPGCF